MKKTAFFLPFVAALLCTASCKKSYLDKAPGVDITENTVFSSRVNLESFMATIYKYGMHSLFRYADQQNFSTTVSVGQYDAAGPTGMMCDEGDASEVPYYLTDNWNTGNILSTNIVASEDYRYYIRWIALRQMALVLSRAKEVPALDPTATTSYINQVTGEVKVLRAMNYLEMIKRYGGVPIVTETYAPGEFVKVPRATLQECIDFILKDCQEAIENPDLPASYSVAQTGRVTKAVAYVVKAKTLLLAASPQFNTATPPLSMPDGDNKLICLGNYDIGRWQKAADAATEAINYVQLNGYSMIDDVTKRDPSDTVSTVPTWVGKAPDGNYKNAWLTFDNTEIILSYKGAAPNNSSNDPIRLFKPTFADGGTSRSGSSVPLNFLRKYEKKDGTPQTWPSTGGADLLSKFLELDPRFKQTICYTNSYYGAADPKAAIYQGGTPGNVYATCKGGTWMRKFLPYGGNVRTNVNDILYRVNELYLYRAEALNEANGAPPAQAYADVNKIRNRSAMPNLPAGLTQAQFRDRVRNESAIELAWEDHRFWDIRRWLIAEDPGVMSGAFEGLKITKTTDRLFSWSTYTFETRTFNKNMYLHPFPQPEVLKGNLKQNPGYF
ncbi:MAG TPA: RagB/SusD family nutrient uptake outer membrane protein [Chitinophagaceae bacterium]|nr:RagB/SusD family nutrient uptake outer membrane protein [Chitinophagaceae bacterium]